MDLTKYTNLFSDERDSFLDICGEKVPLIKKYHSENDVHLIISELVFYSLREECKRNILRELHNFVMKVKKTRKTIVSIYGLKKKSINYLKDDMIINRFCTSICITNKLTYSSNTKRKIRKARANFTFFSETDSKNITEALKLGDLMDFYNNASTDNLDNIGAIKDSIVLLAKKNEKIVACMIGLIHRREAHMIIHYYDHNSNQYYMNYGIYDEFINEVNSRNVNTINWGNSHLYDEGLINFKGIFSTEENETYVVTIQTPR